MDLIVDQNILFTHSWHQTEFLKVCLAHCQVWVCISCVPQQLHVLFPEFFIIKLSYTCTAPFWITKYKEEHIMEKSQDSALKQTNKTHSYRKQSLSIHKGILQLEQKLRKILISTLLIWHFLEWELNRDFFDFSLSMSSTRDFSGLERFFFFLVGWLPVWV